MRLTNIPKTKFILRSSLFFAFIFCCSNVHAESSKSIGRVASVLGQVDVERSGQKIKANKNDPVYESDGFKVGDNGALKIEFDDGSSFMSLKNTIFKVAEYRIHKNKNNDLNIKSTINVVSGKVRLFVKPKQNGWNDSKVTSPNSVMGIRGTMVDETVSKDSSGQDTTSVSVGEGTVSLSSNGAGASQEVTQGTTSGVLGDNLPTPPEPTPKGDGNDFDQASADLGESPTPPANPDKQDEVKEESDEMSLSVSPSEEIAPGDSSETESSLEGLDIELGESGGTEDNNLSVDENLSGVPESNSDISDEVSQAALDELEQATEAQDDIDNIDPGKNNSNPISLPKNINFNFNFNLE